MMNDYADGEVHTRIMTEEEREVYRKRKAEERQKYPWRFRGRKPIQEYMCYAYEKRTQYEAHKKRGRK